MAEAQGHFVAMTDDMAPAFGPMTFDRELSSRSEPTPAEFGYLGYLAGQYAGNLRIVAANLDAGRWPADANPAVERLTAAVRAEQTGFVRLAIVSDLPAFKSHYARLKPAMTLTYSALRAARLALHLRSS